MITIEIYDDGSALRTWVSRDCEHISHYAIPAEQVQEKLKAPCANDPGGCGMCLACKIKHAWEEHNGTKA